MWKQLGITVKEYFSRKFVLACSSLGFGFWLQLEGHDLEGYALLVGVVLASYNGANVAETFALVKGKIGTANSKSTKVDVEVDTGT